jgi:hypothetical protein
MLISAMVAFYSFVPIPGRVICGKYSAAAGFLQRCALPGKVFYSRMAQGAVGNGRDFYYNIDKNYIKVAAACEIHHLFPRP